MRELTAETRRLVDLTWPPGIAEFDPDPAAVAAKTYRHGVATAVAVFVENRQLMTVESICYYLRAEMRTVLALLWEMADLGWVEYVKTGPGWQFRSLRTRSRRSLT